MSMAFQCAARTDIGRRRMTNEDAILSRPDLGVWAVADGMGGHDAGEVASAMIVDGLAELAPGLDLARRTDEAKRVLHDVNRRLVALGGDGPERRTIGSTVVAVFADERSFTCLWAGDSRVYRARAGTLSQITRDHSLVQELVDLGELDPAEAAGHPNANVVTRAVGAGMRFDLDCVEGDVRQGDVFLLASDGLTRLMTDEELMQGLATTALDRTADMFIETCLARGAPDNVSLVILRAG
jgi:serine/threonine protein phosphatase PrpC